MSNIKADFERCKLEEVERLAELLMIAAQLDEDIDSSIEAIDNYKCIIELL